jgi:hypothetical protein
MAHLRPFRDYDEKDVLNLFSMDLTTGTNADGAISLGSDWSGRLSHGHVVSIGTGWNSGQELEMLTDAGAASGALKNVTTQRYGVTASLRSAGIDLSGPAALAPLGLTLFHVAQYDENGEQLKFNPRKASELEACIVGQAVPVVTRGIFLVHDIKDVDGGATVTMDQAWLDAGGDLYAGLNGKITSATEDGTTNFKRIGRALGLPNSDDTLMKLEL